MAFASHPSWVRGLKYPMRLPLLVVVDVAPFMGAWIEIIGLVSATIVFIVAPFMGAWIEMIRGCRRGIPI